LIRILEIKLHSADNNKTFFFGGPHNATVIKNKQKITRA